MHPRGLVVECPECGKLVKARFTPGTQDPLARLTSKHKTPQGAPCVRVEIALPS